MNTCASCATSGSSITLDCTRCLTGPLCGGSAWSACLKREEKRERPLREADRPDFFRTCFNNQSGTRAATLPERLMVRRAGDDRSEACSTGGAQVAATGRNQDEADCKQGTINVNEGFLDLPAIRSCLELFCCSPADYVK